MLEKVREHAFKYAVKNAYLHNGKADVGAVVGKVKALLPDVDLKKAMPAVQEVVKEVNGMSAEELERQYAKFEEQGYELKPKEKEPGLPKLDWAEDGKEKVVTRFAPNPNAPFHLGNSRAAILSHSYARRYGGKFILRFDDTDPKVKRPIADAEQVFKEDLDWLGITIDETYFASDRLEMYYKYLREVTAQGHAYVCQCESEKWKECIDRKQACACRDKNADEQSVLLERMIAHELKEGQAVLRIKTELTHPDPSIRDWWAAKIVDEPEHPRAGSQWKVWPSYNFASAIDDHELGITLIIRGQEHEQNGTKQKYLYNYFEWKYPHEIYTGRVKLEGVILSKSQMEAGIQEGKYKGYDDPRLGTIRALRRRGFTSAAIHAVIEAIGINSNDTTVEWNFLANENKKIIQEKTRTVTFLEKSVKLHVDFTPVKEVLLENGFTVELKEGHESFLVDRKEIGKYGVGKIVRLKNAYNVRLKSFDQFEVHAEYVNDFKIKETVPWLLEENSADVIVVLPDASEVFATADKSIQEIPVHAHVYLERYGFARVDQQETGRTTVWFTHK